MNKVNHISETGIYKIYGTAEDCEILTRQKCPLTGSVGWDPCRRNPFNGDFEECLAEVARRERIVQASKRAA
jgi:hypothetical protein